MKRLELGYATLFNGDCLQVLQALPDSSVDLVLTDLPFSSGARQEVARTKPGKTMNRGRASRERWFGSDSLSTRAFVFLSRECGIQWRRVLRPGGHVLAFIDWRMEETLAQAVESDEVNESTLDWRAGAVLADAVESADLRRAGVVVWDKQVYGQGRHFRSQYELIHHFTKGKGNDPLRRDVPNIIPCRPVRHGLHPTEKPQLLLRTLIETLCPPGGTVADPFAGPFTHARAAKMLGRRFVGGERDEMYYALGVEMLASTPLAA